MKKILFAMSLLAWSGPAVAARGEQLQAEVCGRIHDPVTVQRRDGRIFLNAQQAGGLYGAQAYWYPVSGRVTLSLRGQTVQFLVGSRQVLLGRRSVELDAAVLLRAAQAYVPLDFFLGADFAAFSGMESQYDERSRLLSVERRSNLGPSRWFSYQDFSRVVLELKKPLEHAAAASGAQGVVVSLPFGIIENPEAVKVNDGLIAGYELRQEAKAARLSVRFAKSGLRWRAYQMDQPRRLALEVSAAEFSAPQPPAPAASPQPAASAALPAAAAAPAPAVPAPAETLARRTIVIDAGHGGKDGGADGRHGGREKEINLAVAKELAALLKEERVFNVVLTRGDDSFLPLAERSRIANEAHADLFVSLHCNAHKDSREHGFEVYILSETASDPEAARLAEFENSSLRLEGKSAADESAALILRAMSKTENINAAAELAALVSRSLHQRVDLNPRGVKQAAFYVLRGTDAPAVLVEMAYVSNRKDEAKLRSKSYRRRLVDGIYAGLVDYAKRQHWLGGAP